MGAKNKVIAGDYDGKLITPTLGYIMIRISFSEKIYLDKNKIESYEVITDEHRKSAMSGITRGAIGATLLGPIGLLAGLSAKSKGIYTIALKFKDGKNSLIEINDNLYKILIKSLF